MADDDVACTSISEHLGRNVSGVGTTRIGVAVLPAHQDAAALERGRYLYASRGCVDCHGAAGTGRTFVDDGGLVIAGPNITTGPGGVVAAYQPVDWVRTIRHGVKPDGRPALIDFQASLDTRWMPASWRRWLDDLDMTGVPPHRPEASVATMKSARARTRTTATGVQSAVEGGFPMLWLGREGNNPRKGR